jgi:hypothetical protein
MTKLIKTNENEKKKSRGVGGTIRAKAETWTISAASSPHMCNPRTLFVFAQTTSFIKTLSGSPEMVAFKGLKFAVKISTSPYSCIACKYPECQAREGSLKSS